MATLSDLVPELQGPANELVTLAEQSQLRPVITSTLRGIVKQAQLYEQWIHGLRTLPVAAPGRSAHQYGWAFDMVVTPYEALWDLGDVWEQSGYTWGRNADPVHFELPGASAWLRSASTTEILELVTTFALIPPSGLTGYLAELVGAGPAVRVGQLIG